MYLHWIGARLWLLFNCMLSKRHIGKVCSEISTVDECNEYFCELWACKSEIRDGIYGKYMLIKWKGEVVAWYDHLVLSSISLYTRTHARTHALIHTHTHTHTHTNTHTYTHKHIHTETHTHTHFCPACFVIYLHNTPVICL